MYKLIADPITREHVQEAYARFLCGGGLVTRLPDQNGIKYVNVRPRLKGQNVPIHVECTKQRQ